MARVVARASVVASSRPRAREGRARDAHRASSPWAATGVSTVDSMTTRENDARAFFSRGGARWSRARDLLGRAAIARGVRGGDAGRTGTGTRAAGGGARRRAAAASDETMMKPTVVWMTTTTVRRTIERAPRALVLALAAGVWAQSVNLGGTFVLALFRVHETPAVAATFALAVAVWKFVCSTYVRIVVLRGMETSNEGSRSTRFGFWGDAWEALKASRGALKSVVALDFRRTLSIAWNSLITIPIPYLGLIRLLDYAVAAPVILMEGDVKAGAALKRSQELMYGYRVLLMKTVFLCSAVCAALVGTVIGAFVLFVPTLPSVMMPPVDPATGARAVADVAAGFVNGAAFDRVWVVGTPVERTATLLLLMCGLALSFLFTLGFRELVRLFYSETKARYSPPPPEDPNAKKPSPFTRLRFWKRGREPKADSQS